MQRILIACGFALGATWGTGCNQSPAAPEVDSGVTIEEGAPAAANLQDVEAGETRVALDQLPAEVTQAVTARMAGFAMTAAKREVRRDGSVIYAVLGTVDGKTYEMEISAAGQVLEVEAEDDDDDDGGMDDDGDDDDDDDGDDDGKEDDD